MSTRSGFVALAGRPNVGKSTLLNRIVGEKVAIASERPQTTRRAIRGVATTDRWQAVLVDLPGVQRPRDALTERMQQRMRRELEQADAALFVLNAQQRIGSGDRFIARAIRAARLPQVTALNKIDTVDRGGVASSLSAVGQLELPGEVFPVSALTGEGVPELVAAMVELLPEGPFLYPPDEATDLPGRVRVAELVREQVLRRTRDELPHAVEVDVDEVEEREDGLLVIRARVWTETESQKAILIGAGGRMVREVGTAARREVEALLGRRVHLELTVRARRRWRRDEQMLDRLGIE
jgi:GTP-binding protein Era